MSSQERPEELAPDVEIFPVAMPAWIVLLFFCGVAVVAGVAAWFFKGGMISAGVVMCIVFVPLTILYWFMLVLVPRRVRVLVGPEGLVLDSPSFVQMTLLGEDVRRVFRGNLKADAWARVQDKRKGISFGPYRFGEFELEGGRTAVIAARSRHVLGLETAQGYVLLGPENLDGLEEAVSRHLGV